MVAASRLLDQPALPGKIVGASGDQPVGACHVHSKQLAAAGSLHDANTSPDERVTLLAAAERHHDALTRLPRLLDRVLRSVHVERSVDAIGEPQQSKLAQGGEIAFAEEVSERGVDLLGRVDVPV